MGVFRNLTGEVFKRLAVLEKGKPRKGGKATWVCKCDCGNVKEVREASLLRGHTQSCGCLAKERVSKAKTKHKMSFTPVYKSWTCMKDRCNNPNAPKYKYYGARGIKVCGRWMDKESGFLNFLEDMGDRPEDRTLDRIDNDGDYTPDNFRWSDIGVQNRNRRSQQNTSSKYRGVCLIKSGAWVVNLKVNGENFSLGKFTNEVEAAKTFDQKAREMGYEEAWLNFPKEEMSDDS